MTYQMKLKSAPFYSIRAQQKTIELRLYDEKRQKLRVGDQIEFTCLDHDEPPLLTEVTALYRFDSFAELYAALPLEKCGYTQGEVVGGKALPSDMEAYYSPEEQEKYGVVGIEIQLLSGQDDALIRASRFLSLVLRHKPEAAGITLDEHGWANVDELLKGMQKRYALTMDKLEQIVRYDNKQRYSFNDDHTRIRANQGHSVPVDVELEECEPPEFLYHGTGEKYLESIRKSGLVPKTRLYVHLSPDIKTATAVGSRHGKPVVLIVKSGQMHREGLRFFRSANGVWLTAQVPTKYLTFPDKKACE